MRLYRQRMSEQKKHDERRKNAEQHKHYHAQWDNKKNHEERAKAKHRMQKMHEKRTLQSPTSGSPSQAFRSAQSFGKAVRRAGKALPTSPRKKLCVVKNMAEKFSVGSGLTKSMQRPFSPATEEAVRSFYVSDEVSRQMPGRKDVVTVRIDGQKQKLQKKLMIMNVMEAYKLFRLENPEMEIGKSKFASLRPVNVLPVSEKDQNVCCCSYHENFDLLVRGIQKRVPLLPNSEDLIARTVC